MYCRLKKAYDNNYSEGQVTDLGEVRLNQGLAIDPKLLPASLIFSIDFSESGTFPDYIRFSHALVLSQRFIDLLRGAGVDNLQVFPITLTNDHDGVVYNNYCICNIVGLISCADLAGSKDEPVMDGMYMFEEIAIDLSKTNDVLLFRLAESRREIIIHYSVCNYIIDNAPDPGTEGFDWDELVCN